MEAPEPVHPTSQTLTDYGLGKLDDPQAGLVADHLQNCPDCRRRVGGIAPDSFLGRVRGAQQPSARSATGDLTVDGSLSYVQPRATVPPPSADTLPPGLADHPDYEIKRELGRGGMGVVYLAHNSMMGRDEVLKVIGRHVIERPGVLDRFQREIRAVAKLRHPNIVAAYTAFRLDGGLVFAMEYVEGLDLSKLIKAKGPLSVSHAAYFVHQAALGLQHAHDRDMVHRDIKPHNLMLTHDGKARVIKVLDFGLAKATREQTIDGGLTTEGQALGTPDYIAPEQILDAASADIRADLYSLGGTLFYLLTGRPPFQAASLYDMYQAHISRDVEPLNLVRPEVPAELAALVAKMMAKDPKRRFQTPAEVAQALTPFFKGKAAQPAPKPPLAPPTSPPPTRTLGDESSPVAVSTPVAPPAVGERPWDALIDLGDAQPSILPTKSGKSSPARPAWVKWTMVGAAVLASLIACWAFIVFSTRTPNGTILVDDVPADARVEVEGGTMTITRAGDTATVAEVPVGRDYRIKVVQGETTLWAEDVTVRVGGMPVRMRYKPNPETATSSLAPATVADGKPAPLAPFQVTVTEGDWTIDGDELVQSRLEPMPGRTPLYSIEFGDRSWTDYDISLEACKTAGPDGFGVGFRRQSARDAHGVGFGSYGNLACDLTHVLNGEWGRNNRNYREKAISFGDWHPIKIVVRGSRARCYFDGDLLFDEPDLLFPRGKIGLSTWKTAVRFRKIKVTSPTGDTLLEGLPDLPRSKAQQILEPKRSLADRPVEVASPVAASNPPVPLFNGKDVNDWSAWGTDGPLSKPGKEAVWTVRNGILDGQGAQSHLFSQRGDYQNFRVRAEVKINDGGNSGLYFRARKMAGYPDGYEAQINATAADLNKTGSLYRKPQPTYRVSHSPVPADRWFVLEVEAIDNKIRVRVDGNLQVEWTDEARTYTRGAFAIQAHDQQTHVQVRKLEVTELDPASTPDPAQADGFYPLFNGKDLIGWQIDGGQPSAWRVDDGHLIASGSGDYRQQTFLLSEKSYTDFVLSFEFWFAGSRCDSGVAIRAEPGEKPSPLEINLRNFPDEHEGAQERTGAIRWSNSGRGVDYLNPEQSNLLRPIPSWNEMVVTARGSSVQVRLNGQLVQDVDLERLSKRPSALTSLKRASGRVGFQSHTGEVRFRNIRIKEDRGQPGSSASSLGKESIQSLSGGAKNAKPHPADAIGHQGHFYKVFAGHLSWHEAQARCRELGGHLAVVRDEYTNRFLTIQVNQEGLGGAWLGATDERVEKRWVWVDGTPMNYDNWDRLRNQPNNKQGLEHYAVLLTRFNGTWCDQPDDGREERPGFICQWD